MVCWVEFPKGLGICTGGLLNWIYWVGWVGSASWMEFFLQGQVCWGMFAGSDFLAQVVWVRLAG